MKEAYFAQFGQIFCNDFENFIAFLKASKFFKEVKGKKYTNNDLVCHQSIGKHNGLSYIIKTRNTPFSKTLTLFSCKGEYFKAKQEVYPALNRLFSVDLKTLAMSNAMKNNAEIQKIFADLGAPETNNAPNVLSVGDIDGLKQFFVDCKYELGLNNFEKLIEDYSEYDDEFLFKLNFILDMYQNTKFKKKLMLGDSYHYIKCDVDSKEVFSYANDSSEDYFFIFERDINTKNIRVFFDFMSNIDKNTFNYKSCVVGDQPNIVKHYLLNETPCFESVDGNTKVIKNTQTYLLDDIEYIASTLAKHLKVKLPEIFSIY